MYPSANVPVTHRAGSSEGRVQVDVGSTGFFLGREFRAYQELNAASTTTRYFRFTSTVNFILFLQRLSLVSGARRLSAWLGATFSGTWVPVPVIGKNRMSDVETPLYTSQVTIETALSGVHDGQFTGGTEVDLLMVNSPTNQGNQSSSNVMGDLEVRGLPPGVYGVKLEAIPGVANTDLVRGIYDIGWEERPVNL